MLTYMGTFLFLSSADQRWKTWHLWGIIDDEGDVVAIHYGISSNLQCASGEILRSDCDSDLRKKAFKVAEEWMPSPGEAECEVIDLGDRR